MGFDAAGDVATSIEVWRFAAGGIEPLFTRDAQQPYCDYTPAATATPYVPGLIVGADVLSPEGHRPDYGVHIRFTGGIGAAADFETLRAADPDSAVLDCRGRPAYRFEPRHDPNLAFMAYVPHVGEGRIESCAARAEVARYLQRVQQRDRRYSLIHGVATDREDYAVMRESDVTLVWSPRSNLALYGQTVDIAGALEEGVRVALSTDWSPSGSFTCCRVPGNPVYSCAWSRSSTCTSRGSLRACTWRPPKRFRGSSRKAGR